MNQGTIRRLTGSARALTAALTLLAASVIVAEAAAGITPAQKCEGKKNQVAGEYADCIAAAEKRWLLYADATAYAEKLARCEAVYSDNWQTLEGRAGAGVCPSEGDEIDIQDFLDACKTSVSGALAGGELGLDPVTCNAALADALAANATCDAGTIVDPDAMPVCPAAICTEQCDPVDTNLCRKIGAKYVCPPPACTCGSFNQTTACTMPAPDCDPVCEPPACGINCDANQCGDTSCPSCDMACGVAKCSARCSNWDITSPCGATFGCSIPRTNCSTTCKPTTCYWYNREMSPVGPTCEAVLPGDFVEAPGKTGLDCSAAPGSQDRDWAILCDKPECEIRCPAAVPASCDGQAQCEVDCTDPVCEVTCDTPVCHVDPATGTNDCSPPQNCTTSCSCRVGICTRSR